MSLPHDFAPLKPLDLSAPRPKVAALPPLWMTWATAGAVSLAVGGAYLYRWWKGASNISAVREPFALAIPYVASKPTRCRFEENADTLSDVRYYYTNRLTQAAKYQVRLVSFEPCGYDIRVGAVDFISFHFISFHFIDLLLYFDLISTHSHKTRVLMVSCPVRPIVVDTLAGTGVCKCSVHAMARRGHFGRFTFLRRIEAKATFRHG
jgi:hypothetical protein